MSISSDRDKSNICNNRSILGTFGDFSPSVTQEHLAGLRAVHGITAPSNVLLVDSQPAASCGLLLVDICIVLVVGTVGRILFVPLLYGTLVSGLGSLPLPAAPNFALCRDPWVRWEPTMSHQGREEQKRGTRRKGLPRRGFSACECSGGRRMIHLRSSAKREWCKQRDEIGRDTMSSQLESCSQASP